MLKMQKYIPQDLKCSTAGNWKVLTPLGEILVVTNYQGKWEFIGFNMKSMVWIIEKKLHETAFETRKEALECLEAYLREDNLL